MAADQERADRIRALKREHPEFTWQAVAERVGVSLRAAQSWQETGGIAYENAKRLAELWEEDVDYIMRGERPATPDLSLDQVRTEFRGDVDGVQEQLDRIEAAQQAIRADQTEILRLLRLVITPSATEPLTAEEIDRISTEGLSVEELPPDQRRRAG